MKTVVVKKSVIVMLCVYLWTFTACKTAYVSCKPAEANMQDVTVDIRDGQIFLFSMKQHTSVLVQMQKQELGEEITLGVAVSLNPDENSKITIFPTSVEAYVTDKSGNRFQIQTYDPDMYINILKKKQDADLRLKKALAGFNAGINQASYLNGTQSASEYHKNLELQKKWKNEQREESQMNSAQNSEMYSQMLKSNTLDIEHPIYEGMVKFKNTHKDLSEITIRIPLGKESHEFKYNLEVYKL